MTRMRWIGVLALVGAGVSVLGAIGLGVAVSQDAISREIGIAGAIAAAVLAEVLMWTGGAILGVSFLAKRGGWLRRIFARRPAGVDGEGR